MVTQIQLGNMFNSGGKTIITGGGTGLDIETLVGDLAAAKRAPAVLLESKIETNVKKSETLAEMQALLTDFKDAANFLRNPPGVGNDADNIFQFRNASVTSNTSITGATYLSVTAEPGTSVGEHEVTITQLATRNVQTTDTFALTDADTSAVGGMGPLNAGTLLVGPGATAITLVAGDTLNEVAAKVNAAKNASGIEATVVKVSNGNYRLVFRAVETGTSHNYNIVTLNPGMFNVAFDSQVNAVNASMEFDGTTIVRQSNSIDDVVDGLTFNLLQATPAMTELDVSVGSDNELVKQGILNFVDAYNAFRLFTSRQSELGGDGKPTENAVLSGNASMRLAQSRVNAEIGRIVDGIASGDPSRLSDLGVKFSDFPGDEETPFTRNILTVDEEALDSALASDFDGVRRVFEFDYSSDDPSLQVFSRTNALGVSEVALNINQTAQVFQATYTLDGVVTTVNLDKENITGGGITLRGQEGTALEGLLMIYADAGDVTVNLDVTQGIGDRVYNALDDMLSDDFGIVEMALTSVSDQSARYQEEIERIDEQIEKFRQQLLEKFSALEQAISSANTLLQSLDAQARAQQSA